MTMIMTRREIKEQAAKIVSVTLDYLITNYSTVDTQQPTNIRI